MVVAHVADHTGGTSKTSNTTVTATLASNVAAGDLLVITVAADNLSSSTPTVSSIDVPSGETASWVQLCSHISDSATAAAACVGEMWGIITTQQWNTGRVTTVTLSGAVTAKATSLSEFSGVTLTLRSGFGNSATSAAGTPTVTSIGTAPATGDLVLGLASCEQNVVMTADSDTLNGTWSSGAATATTGGSSTTNMSTIQQYKIVTAGGQQTYNPTGGSDSGCSIATLVPATAWTQSATDDRGLVDSTDSGIGVSGTLSPDAILVETNLTGPVSYLQDDPASPDANWVTHTASGVDLRVSFPTPPASLVSGAGLQTFRILSET